MAQTLNKNPEKIISFQATPEIFHADDSNHLTFMFGGIARKQLAVKLLIKAFAIDELHDTKYLCEALWTTENLRQMIEHLERTRKSQVSVDTLESLVMVVLMGNKCPWIVKSNDDEKGIACGMEPQKHDQHAWFRLHHLGSLKKALLLSTSPGITLPTETARGLPEEELTVNPVEMVEIGKFPHINFFYKALWTTQSLSEMIERFQKARRTQQASSIISKRMISVFTLHKYPWIIMFYDDDKATATRGVEPGEHHHARFMICNVESSNKPSCCLSSLAKPIENVMMRVNHKELGDWARFHISTTSNPSYSNREKNDVQLSCGNKLNKAKDKISEKRNHEGRCGRGRGCGDGLKGNDKASYQVGPPKCPVGLTIHKFQWIVHQTSLLTVRISNPLAEHDFLLPPIYPALLEDWSEFAQMVYSYYLEQRESRAVSASANNRAVDPDTCWPEYITHFGYFQPPLSQENFFRFCWRHHPWSNVKHLITDLVLIRGSIDM